MIDEDDLYAVSPSEIEGDVSQLTVGVEDRPNTGARSLDFWPSLATTQLSVAVLVIVPGLHQTQGVASVDAFEVTPGYASTWTFPSGIPMAQLPETGAEDESLPQSFRAAEIAWLEAHHEELAARFHDMWIGIDGSELVGSAPDLTTLLSHCAAQGHPSPFVTFAPAEAMVSLHLLNG